MAHLDLYKCFDTSDFKTIANADIADVQRIPLAEIFQYKRLLSLKIQIDAQKAGFKDEDLITLECIPNRVGALKTLASSLSHTEAFNEVRENARNTLKQKLNDHDTFFPHFLKWKKLDKKPRLEILRTHRNLYLSSLSSQTGLDFSLPRTRVFRSSEQFDQTTQQYYFTGGYFSESQRNGSSSTRVSLNSHKDTEFNSPYSALSINGHELLHAFQDSLAAYFERRPEALGHLKKDAELVYLMKKHQGYIPSKIPPCYTAQFLETVAFDEGRKQREVMRSIRPELVINNSEASLNI